MSYTIPDYVDTKEQAVLAVASAIADEDKSALGNGSVNRALDILADVLAEQDVSVPQTNAGAILALAQYVTGGGGGGSSDFTTAKLTFSVNEFPGGPSLECSVAMDFPEDGFVTTAATVEENGTYDVVLYKGTAYARVPSITGYTVTSVQTSGSIEQDAGRSYFITGDCSIEITLVPDGD